MKRNMKQWAYDYIHAPEKKAMPILSFPGVQIIGHTVDQLVRSGELQAQCMQAVSERFDTGAAFSLMDLSVEAEAFGAPICYSEDDVPTVHGILIHDEAEAEALETVWKESAKHVKESGINRFLPESSDHILLREDFWICQKLCFSALTNRKW